MTTDRTPDPIEICEETIRADRQYNIEHGIFPSHVTVATRLLKRRLELTDAYRDLHGALGNRPHALEALFQVLMATAAHWSPKKLDEARQARDELTEVNQEIAVTATRLADLLERRSVIHNTSAFRGDTHFHVCQVLEDAAAKRPLFQSWLAGPLDELQYRFDLKYWPTLGEFVDAIARDASPAAPIAADSATEAATRSSRASLADFFLAFLANIGEAAKRLGGWIPTGYRPSDATVAALVTCALDLGPNVHVDAAYVKRLRQRQRERAYAVSTADGDE